MHNYILQNENAVFYECGYSCDNEIFISIKDKKFFLTDSRYSIEAKEILKDVEVIEIKKPLIKEASELIKKLEINEIVFDPYDFTYADFNELSDGSHIEFIPKPFFSKEKRIIKSKKEIDILKKASELGASCFDEFAKFLNENKNLSEEEMFFNASLIFKQKGKLELSFNPIVAINENAAKAHALPTTKIIKNGDLLLLDAGVRYKKYCSDRTRTSLYNGNLNFTKEQKFKDTKIQEIYEIVKEAQSLAIKKAKPGNTAFDVDFAARDFIKKQGYGDKFLHSTGHGVGIDIHEFPNINSKNNMILKEGMVFSIEPGIYLEGEFGIRIEDVVAINTNGCEIL